MSEPPSSQDNPFERFEIDPREGPRAITERMRELMEESTSDEERTRLRAVWEELTMHPARRLRVALRAHPETREPLGSPPSPLAAAAASTRPSVGKGTLDLTLAELAMRPSVARALTAARGAETLTASSILPSIEDDPLLRRARDVR
ncbi:MAG: hypothetical protein JWM74_5192 [Myxococcaceae bacterium]|jgi:hypothetical protein|nr:hypothetical protein [Myxococcaceae bacterium]